MYQYKEEEEEFYKLLQLEATSKQQPFVCGGEPNRLYDSPYDSSALLC